MSKRKKVFSKAGSVLMCVAMTGSAVASSLPVWATSEDEADDGIKVEVPSPEETSQSAVPTLFSLDDGIDVAADTDIGSDSNFPATMMLWIDGDVGVKISTDDTVKVAMAKLLEKQSITLNPDAVAALKIDYVYSDGSRFTFDDTNTVKDLYFSVTGAPNATLDIVVYDNDTQYLRAAMSYDDDEEAFVTSSDDLKLGVSYDGIQRITYDANGGTLGDADAISWRDSGDMLSHIDNTASKDGYQPDGWSLSPDSSEKVTSTTPVSDIMAAGGVLYAIWADNTATITFHTGDTELDPEPISVSIYKPISASETAENDFPDTLTRPDGSKFLGWFTAETGGEQITKDSTVTSDIDVYARWEADTTTYTVKFDANGGTVVGDSTMTVAKNGKLGNLPSAQRDNFAFDGWYTEADGGDKIGPNTVPNANVTYYAHWSKSSCDLTFDLQGGTFVDSDSVTKVTYKYGDSVDSLPDVTKPGYVFKGWFTEPEGKGTAVKAGYTIKEHVTVYAYFVEDIVNVSVTFDANGGTVSETSRTLESGDEIGTLPTPTRTGYTFDGWFTEQTGGAGVSATTVVNTDVTYYAHWTKLSNPVKTLSIAADSLTFDISDTISIDYTYGPQDADNAVFYWTSSNANVVRVKNGTELECVGAGTTTLTIHTADGSLSDSVEVTVTAPKVVVTTLKFDQPEQTVEDADGFDTGFTYGPQNAENAHFVWTSSDSEIIEIASDGSGYKFNGKTGDVTITIATADGSISAKMLVHVIDNDDDDNQPPIDITYKVMFNEEGGKSVADIMVKAGGDVTELPTTTRDGYTFEGWALANGTKVTGLKNITNDVTLYAQWSKIPDPVDERVTVTFEAQNGTPAVKQKVNPGTSLSSLPVPTRTGYTFLGWFTTSARGGEQITTSTKFNSDTTIYAHWVETATKDRYTLTLDPQGGQINGVSGLTVAGIKLETGKGYWNSIASFVATRSGYTFNGWADEDGVLVYDVNGNAIYGTKYWQDADTYTGRDLTVYAQWIKNATVYTLRYDTRGGNDIHPVSYTEGSVVDTFATPTYAGYRFDGWFTDTSWKNEVTSLTMDKDYTLYAKWTKLDVEEPVKQYTITFDSQGGSEVESVTANAGTVVEMQTPVYAGHTFEGWYTEPEGGTRLLSLTVSQNMTLYAHWAEDVKPVVKTMITFDYNDGTGATRKVSAPVGTTLDSLPIAARHGYTFDGWFDSPENGVGEAYKTYVVGDEPATLYAHWTKNSEDTSDVMFTLTFDSMSGSYVAPIIAPEGKLITSLPVPTREGYVFAGWYTDPSDSGDKVDTIELHANATLYAHWTEASDNVWEVTLNDGVTTPHTWALDTSVVFNAFTTPVRDGYTFDGWFTKPEGGEKVGPSYSYNGDKDVTFYAHWTKNSDTDNPTNPTDNKVSYIKLSADKLTKTMGEDLGLTFTYGPKGAVNAKFVWTSSNEDVMKVVTKADGTQTFEYVGAGKTVLTIATEDGSVSDSCELTVKEAEEPSVNVTYTLNITLPDDSTAKATVKGTSLLSNLATKLGYSVPNWSVDGSDTKIDGSVTMKELADMVGADGMTLRASDSDGNTLALVSVKASGENTFDVVVKTDADEPGTDNPGTDNPNKPDDGNENPTKPDDSNNTNNPTTPGNNTGNQGNNNGTTNNGTNNGTNNTDNTSSEVKTYNLTVVSTTGSTSKVSIKGNKTLAELAEALGYNDVGKWAVKQANIDEYGIDGSTTMSTFAELIQKNGDLAIIAYNSDGTVKGCAKVVADDTEGSYTVTLSKDTNVALRSASEINEGKGVGTDGKGKGDTTTNTVSNDGKSDGTAPVVNTADVATLPLYGALGGMSSVLLAVVTFLKKRFK